MLKLFFHVLPCRAWYQGFLLKVCFSLSSENCRIGLCGWNTKNLMNHLCYCFVDFLDFLIFSWFSCFPGHDILSRALHLQVAKAFERLSLHRLAPRGDTPVSFFVEMFAASKKHKQPDNNTIMLNGSPRDLKRTNDTMAWHCHHDKSHVTLTLICQATSTHWYRIKKEIWYLFSRQKRGHNSSKPRRENVRKRERQLTRSISAALVCRKYLSLTHDTHSQPEINHLRHDLT